MTVNQLRELLAAHVAQPGYKRNPGHIVVAIYLGRDEWHTLVDDRNSQRSLGMGMRAEGEVSFDGVPVYRVNDKGHVRIVSEYLELESRS